MEGNNVQQNSLISLPEEDLNDKMNHAEMNIDSMKKSADQDFINDATDSENALKVTKLKPLESEQRNTSTSNAGESEYESANEEEIILNVVENSTESKSLVGLVDSLDNNKEQTRDITSELKIENDENKSCTQNDSSKEDYCEDENTNCTDEDDSFSVEELSEENEDPKEVVEENDSVDNEIEDKIEYTKTDSDKHEIADQNDGGSGERTDEKESIKVSNANLNQNNTDVKQTQSNAKSKTKSQTELQKAKRNPQYIPRKGSYFEHDDRGDEKPKNNDQMNTIDEEDDNDGENKIKSKKQLTSMKMCSDTTENLVNEKFDSNIQTKKAEFDYLNEKTESNNKNELKKKPIWDSSEKWHHDKFNLEDQKPKTKEELISTYGYDIRTETEAPRLNRRSKYGKGPQRYSRKSSDANAYAKKTLHKVIKNSNRSSQFNCESNDTNAISKQQPQSSAHLDKRDCVFEKKSLSKDVSSGTNTRIFENGRIFVNKSGSQSQKYLNSTNSTSNDKSTNKSTISNNLNESASMNSSKSANKSSISNNLNEFTQVNSTKPTNKSSLSNNLNESTQVNSTKFTNKSSISNNLNESAPISSSKSTMDNIIENKNSVEMNVNSNNDGDNNNKSSKEANNKFIFTNEDFPALTPVSNSTNNNKNDNENVESLQTDEGNDSKVIYYQNKSTTITNSQNNNDNQNTAAISKTNESTTRGTERYRQNVQPQLPTVESVQLENNARYSKNKTLITGTVTASNSTTNNATLVYTQNPNWNNQPNSNRNVTSKTHGNRKYDSNDTNDNNNDNDLTMTKRYSSTRHQSRIITSHNASGTVSDSMNNANSNTQPSPVSTVVNSPNQYLSLNNEELQPMETTKNATYYDPSTSNAIPPSAVANINLSAANPVHPHVHNYTPINGSTRSNATATPNAAAAYIPAGPNTLMAFYDPNSTPGQAAGTASATGLQGPIGLTQAYFTTDQTGAAQAAAAQNYYLTTDLTVAYHSPTYLPANYPQALTASHHTHQSHVANRYLNTTPSGTSTSAESNRYLQTTPNQNTTPILMSGNLAGQSFTATIPAAFPSGYPQFPPQSASSPLPAGYPNVPLGNSNNPPSNSTQTPTPSGYPELYRGDGITYYDIPSQQQAMQRIQNTVGQSSTNRRKVHGGHQQQNYTSSNANNIEDIIESNNTTNKNNSKKLDSNPTSTNNANEIPVNN